MSEPAPLPLEPGLETDLAGKLTYGRYLALDELLDCQRPVSDSHDELLFIVIHQATELWLKVMVHELRQARARLVADDLQPAFKMLARVARIQAQLIQSWDVLSTLTPADYLAFRHKLGPASGLQSHQHRLLEFILGNKQPGMLTVHRHTPEVHAELAAELARPSLYDETIRLLARRGLAIDAAQVERDWREPYRADARVRAAWREVYLAPASHWDLYELAEELVDLED
ncbi:MAG: tryptophan 2,3-dioxygenase, partial [Geminicoccaceae bacterium]